MKMNGDVIHFYSVLKVIITIYRFNGEVAIKIQCLSHSVLFTTEGRKANKS